MSDDSTDSISSHELLIRGSQQRQSAEASTTAEYQLQLSADSQQLLSRECEQMLLTLHLQDPSDQAPLTPPLSTPTTPPPKRNPHSGSKSINDGVSSPHSPQHPATGTPAPPREERCAPEGTSSPTPRPREEGGKTAGDSATAPSGYMSKAEVDALLKRQEAQFEQRLQRVNQSSDQKEQDLHSQMQVEQKELAELRAAVVEVTQSRESLLKMLEQYKDMLAAVVHNKGTANKDTEQRIKDLEAQKSQALEDLSNVEAAFSDVHRKYERTKQVVETMRRNEESLRAAVTDYDARCKKQEAKLVNFQQHAEEKMQQASEEYDTLKRNTDQELTKMSALLKKAEMKIMSLQEQLDRKGRDNTELTQLLDDLISKMGPDK